MKRIIFALFFISVALYSTAQEDSDVVKVGDTMPAFTIVSDNGNEFKSSSLQGKVILLNFFATWCPPCQKELAAVQETLWPKYKNHAGFVMLVVGREHSDADLATYNEKKGFTFPLYPDKSRAIYSSFAKSLIPRTYLIGKDGKIIYASKGYNDAEFAELMSKIEKALK
ncbi:peroxiredoxin [Parabacteroides sp. PF5-5]|uniref:TlpA family protein disulfide reductase n=1 Tax=unclassified Parabacteroides TaxID=2649774 RepID=UPI002472FA1A|nr:MULTISPECIES: TlpA disulfide reductase family protein [unclassified Parabacteroides]MDH6304168.1 peroxiredoxin [Parabacteroides sp. PH5-39]MDH6315116.1 peroxiredoxin [Parabacteroides sp. PF5-13]MDH6318777.1 peroxiredoxin [Parabacteroides sp. PH5-13]MDH6322506.1 peroxiredoxin [Parabacteroides sp. PH5-8]MDH6326358.1 peroxiredoxin [Parabacteroides sp. PH5-41]